MSDDGTHQRQHTSYLYTPSFRKVFTQHGNDNEATFTIRSVLFGIAIGLMVCCANLYLGLQAGLVNSMTIPSALMGYAFFKLISGYLQIPFTPGENVLVQTISSSLGNMPVTSGLNGVIPAIEYLVGPEDNGPITFSRWQLLVWSIGTSLLGIVFALALREYFVLQKPLRFPTGTASAVLIGMLHKRDDIIETIEKDRMTSSEVMKPSSTGRDASESNPQIEDQDLNNHVPEHSHPRDNPSDRDSESQGFLRQHRFTVLAFVASAVFTLLAYFIPQLEAIPILGIPLWRDWGWSLDPGPEFIGFGMIMDPIITAWVMVGAVLGWGVLSPIAKTRGWAPGSVTNWSDGSQGWIVWVALGAILGDSAVGIAWLILQPLASSTRYRFNLGEKLHATLKPRNSQLDTIHAESSNHASTHNNEEETANETTTLLKQNKSYQPVEEQPTIIRVENPRTVISKWTVILYLVLAFLLCLCATIYLFGNMLSVWQVLLAVLLIGPLGIGSIRAMGDTDNSLASTLSKISQFLFALIIPNSNPNAITTSLIVGAVAEAGVFQSSDVMEHFKTGFLTGASPRAIFYGQAIGSLVGAVFSTFVYRLYTSVYEIPSKRMPAPAAQLWYATAKLAYGRGLPPHAWDFSVAAFILAMILAIVRLVAAQRPWVDNLPSGIAIGVGIYVLPGYTIPLAIGGFINYYCKTRMQVGELSIITIASAFVLGAGVFNLVNIVMGLLGVPHL